MIREWMTIVKHEQLAKDTYKLVLQGEMAQHIQKPGQFVHIEIDSSHYLRRPISISDFHREERTITLIYKVFGKGTDTLRSKKPGERLNALGPGGNGFPVEESAEKAVIIGGGIGVPPLYSLAKHLREKGCELTMILGFQSTEDAFLINEFKELGDTYIATNDGSLGAKGFVTDVLATLEESFDRYYTCGPTVMLQAVAKQMMDTPGYISMEERMGCGIGACFACVVPANDEKGYRKICCDGPVFHSGEVVLA